MTSAPDVEIHPVTLERYVLIGTGQLLNVNDVPSTQVQTFYAIIDGGCWLEINGHPPLCLSGGDVVDLQEIESLLRELLSLRAAPQARRTAETQAK